MHTERTTSKLGVIERYRDYLPVTESTPIVSLGEGNTPLVFCPRLSERVGLGVFVKHEGVNPTGSFKDRGCSEGHRARRKGCHVRCDRKHLGFSRGLCSARGHLVCRDFARRKN